jgi:hypothetical protein
LTEQTFQSCCFVNSKNSFTTTGSTGSESAGATSAAAPPDSAAISVEQVRDGPDFNEDEDIPMEDPITHNVDERCLLALKYVLDGLGHAEVLKVIVFSKNKMQKKAKKAEN